MEVRLGNVEEKVEKMEVRFGNVEEKVEKMEVRMLFLCLNCTSTGI